MPIVAWYILAISPAVALLLIDGLRMLAQRRARRALTVASLDHALTVRRLDAAKAEARDVIDAATLPLSKSPAAQRIRNQIADNECRRFRDELDQWGA